MVVAEPIHELAVVGLKTVLAFALHFSHPACRSLALLSAVQTLPLLWDSNLPPAPRPAVRLLALLPALAAILALRLGCGRCARKVYEERVQQGAGRWLPFGTGLCCSLG